MPSTSKKQHNFMAAIANNPSFAKKVGVSQSVGKDFNAADKGKTFNKGGIMKKRKFATGGLEDEGFTPEESYDEEGNPSTVYRKGFSPNIRMSEKKSTAKVKPAAKAKSADKNKPAGDTYFDGDYPSSMITTSSGFKKYVPKSGRGLVGIVGNEDEGDRLRARLGDTDDQFKGISRAGRLFRRDTEAGIKQMKRGGMMKESKAMVGKEVSFMQKKGAPASMIKHEKAEMGMKKGGMPMKDGKPAFIKKFVEGGAESDAYELEPQRMGRQEGAKEYLKRKQTEDSISNPIVRGLRKATTYAKDKYGDLRDDVRTAITSDDSAAFRKGQRAIREKVYGYKKGGMPMKDGKPSFMKKFAKGGVTGRSGYVANGKRENSTTGDSVAGENPKIQKRGLTEGRVIKMASGGSVGSASRRADGIAQRGKTRC